MTTREAASSPPPTARDGYIAHALAQLYPPPLRLEVGRTRSPDARATFLPLPPRHPHVVVPAGHPQAGARAVQRQFNGRRRRTRVARWLLTRAVRSGAADLLSPGRLTVSGPAEAESVDRLLAEVIGAPEVLITMPVGPARANRKPVLQVTDLEGAALAFVKIGHDDLTRALVCVEALALKQLARAGLRHTRAPRVLAELNWRDLNLLVLEPLPTAPRETGKQHRRQALLKAIREIAALSTWHGDWTDNPYRSRLRAELLACGARGVALLGALDGLDSEAPNMALGSWHGDLNPGNIAVLPDQVLVWDWERFDDGVPVGFDLLHHHLHQAITIDGREPKAAAGELVQSAGELLSALDVTAQAADSTARLYLLALAARYLRDEQARAGAPLGAVDDWIVPVLTTTSPR